MQTVVFTGNLGADPVVKSFDNGGKVANFNVGVTERGYTTKDGKEIPDHTEWFRCVVKQTGLCNVIEQYVKKGNKVAIVGKLRTREYEDKGEKKNITELIVESMELLTPKGSAETPKPSQPSQPEPQQFTKEEGDSLPF